MQKFALLLVLRRHEQEREITKQAGAVRALLVKIQNNVHGRSTWGKRYGMGEKNLRVASNAVKR